MTDAVLRQFERRWLETGSVADESAYLRCLVQQGRLSYDDLAVCSHCGHPAAWQAMEETGPLPQPVLMTIGEFVWGLPAIPRCWPAVVASELRGPLLKLWHQIPSESETDIVTRSVARFADGDDRATISSADLAVARVAAEECVMAAHRRSLAAESRFLSTGNDLEEWLELSRAAEAARLAFDALSHIARDVCASDRDTQVRLLEKSVDALVATTLPGTRAPRALVTRRVIDQLARAILDATLPTRRVT